MQNLEIKINMGGTPEEMDVLFYRAESAMATVGVSYGMTMQLTSLNEASLLITLPFSKKKEALEALEMDGLIPTKAGETND